MINVGIICQIAIVTLSKQFQSQFYLLQFDAKDKWKLSKREIIPASEIVHLNSATVVAESSCDVP